MEIECDVIITTIHWPIGVLNPSKSTIFTLFTRGIWTERQLKQRYFLIDSSEPLPKYLNNNELNSLSCTHWWLHNAVIEHFYSFSDKLIRHCLYKKKKNLREQYFVEMKMWNMNCMTFYAKPIYGRFVSWSFTHAIIKHIH